MTLPENNTSDAENPVENRASVKKLGYVGRTPGTERDSNAWFTPSKYIESSRTALGGSIDLDPFSDAAANAKSVKAVQFFTEQDNAFTQDWALMKNGQRFDASKGRTVFMNPPYSGKLCAEAVNMFLDEFAKGSFTEGIFLVNNGTETRWFQRAFGLASAVCFTNHRISFWNEDGKSMSGNTRGQAFFYLGKNPDRFIEAFKEHGATFKLPASSPEKPE